MAIKYYVISQTYKCPVCGKKYDYTAKSTGPFGLGNASHNFKYYLSNPIIKCKSCGSEFSDKRMQEYVTMNEEARESYFNNYKSKGPVVWLIIFAVYAIAGVIAALAAQNAMILTMTGVALLLMIIPGCIKRKRNGIVQNHIFDNAIKDSLKRCKAKEHLERLVFFGYKLYPLNKRELANNPGYEEINKLIEEIDVDGLQNMRKKDDKEREERLGCNFHVDVDLESDSITLKESEYDNVMTECTEPNEIVALFVDKDNSTSKFVKIKIGNKASIEQYLKQSSGQAMRMRLKKGVYWFLQSSVNYNALIFRGNDTENGFESVLESDKDVAEYFLSIM